MRCLALRHVHFEDAGVFAPVLARRGVETVYLESGRHGLSRKELVDAFLTADLALVLGGPVGVNDTALYPWIADELAAVEARLTSGRPLLGICLGAQYMAAVLGGSVHPGPRKEIGWGVLSLTEAGRQSVLAPLEKAPVLHWHGDTFDLPKGTERLASSDITPNQAFRVGRGQLALQFHAECDPASIESWLIGHCCELVSAGVDIPALRATTREVAAQAVAAGQAVMERYLDECGIPEPDRA